MDTYGEDIESVGFCLVVRVVHVPKLHNGKIIPQVHESRRDSQVRTRSGDPRTGPLPVGGTPPSSVICFFICSFIVDHFSRDVFETVPLHCLRA